MDELGKDRFPKVCWGCFDNCYKCTRRIGSASVPVIRELVATRIMKNQAIARMERDIAKIDEQLQKLLPGSSE